jgi:hypothetical protein
MIALMNPNVLPGIFRLTKQLSAAALLATSCFAPPTQGATFRSYGEAVAGSYFPTDQPLMWVGDQPPDEAESLSFWIVLDNWRANGSNSTEVL